MNISEAVVLTTSLSNEVAIIPQGARIIDIVNTGGSIITFVGNSSQGSLNLNAVSVAVSQAYSFGDVGKPYPSTSIDCTGGSADVVVVY